MSSISTTPQNNSSPSSSQSLPTLRSYFFDTYKWQEQAQVVNVGKDANGRCYIVLDSTLFHPQGGGQPADKGYIESLDKSIKCDVTGLSEDKTTGIIQHFVEQLAFEKGDKVNQVIDLKARSHYARLHTAGHLISSLVESLNPGLNGYKGNHFPNGEAYVMFKGKIPDSTESLKENLQKKLDEMIERKTKMIIDNQSQPRTAQIEGLSSYPCGGTHLRDMGELESVAIRNVKSKKGELRIGYDVLEPKSSELDEKSDH